MYSKKNKEISAEDALNRAAALCSRGEQCEADIRTKLASWGITPNDADSIISRLTSLNFINEERFAHAFVRDKFRFGGWGRIKIAYALRQKHIDAGCIDEALTEISEEEYIEALNAALKGKLRSVAHRKPIEQRAALYRFAASRGYESALTGKVTSILLASTDDHDGIDFYAADDF